MFQVAQGHFSAGVVSASAGQQTDCSINEQLWNECHWFQMSDPRTMEPCGTGVLDHPFHWATCPTQSGEGPVNFLSPGGEFSKCTKKVGQGQCSKPMSAKKYCVGKGKRFKRRSFCPSQHIFLKTLEQGDPGCSNPCFLQKWMKRSSVGRF